MPFGGDSRPRSGGGDRRPWATSGTSPGDGTRRSMGKDGDPQGTRPTPTGARIRRSPTMVAWSPRRQTDAPPHLPQRSDLEMAAAMGGSRREAHRCVGEGGPATTRTSDDDPNPAGKA